MTHDEIIALLQAHKDGKTLQIKHKLEWLDLNYILSAVLGTIAKGREWRIKPEPVGPQEVWVNIYPSMSGYCAYYLSKEAADSVATKARIACIRYVPAEEKQS